MRMIAHFLFHICLHSTLDRQLSMKYSMAGACQKYQQKGERNSSWPHHYLQVLYPGNLPCPAPLILMHLWRGGGIFMGFLLRHWKTSADVLKNPLFPAFLLNLISCCHCVSINNERQNWIAPFLQVFPWPNAEMSFYLVDKHMKDILSWCWTLTLVLLSPPSECLWLYWKTCFNNCVISSPPTPPAYSMSY